MKIEYRIGDMLDGPEIYLAHGCNAQGVMGSGVAKAVRARYPKAYDVYRNKFVARGLQLGEVVEVEVPWHSDFRYRDQMVPTKRFVFNCITQNSYGRDGRRYVNYGAVESTMRYINKRVADTLVPVEVGMSMIGSSLGGGDWNIISDIIERRSTNFRPIVYDMTP